MTVDMKRYAGATRCMCGALIEEIVTCDAQNFSYWAHVKRRRLAFDHAAVPDLESAR
jgi:hypothetical protein